MKLLANENMPVSVVARLREFGHDVLAAKESMRGASDPEVLSRAVAESRVLVTQDKDFGELVFRSHLSADCGVILFRLDSESPEEDLRRMVSAIQSRSDWAGMFAVVDPYRIRLRPITRWCHYGALTTSARC